jgi:hypothetical protein
LGTQISSKKWGGVETALSQKQFLRLTSCFINKRRFMIGCHFIAFAKDEEFRAVFQLLEYLGHPHLWEGFGEFLPVNPNLEATQVHPGSAY